MNNPNSSILQLHQLALYNTGRMPADQVIAAFAVHQPMLGRIMADLGSEKANSRAQHHLVIGQRGMGKTMLLSRISAELSSNPDFKERFIPLTFAEEQYSVDRLSKFWLNCLDSLADALELANNQDAVDGIDDIVQKLTQAPPTSVKDDNLFAEEVYDAFSNAIKTIGRRPVLLVDNLQIVFERLGKSQQHALRELLMRPGAPVFIGASPSPPPQTNDYQAAFYDQFKTHYLHPLGESEMRELLFHLAEVAGRDDVRQRVAQHPERLKVLRQLTGGNPRTTLTLFFLYAEDFAPSVFGDLEGLLDRVTPLYKARFEELTAQQQVITSAIANHWDPVTAAKLAQSTAIPQTSITPQLDRLEKTGVIERVELFGESRTGFQIAERFFNIWFLMRSASRRQRREVEFLTRFLENFYEPTDRLRIANHLMGEEQFSPDRYLWNCAVADSLDDSETAEDLKRHTELLALREAADQAQKRMHELIDFDSLSPATLAFDEMRKALINLVPTDAGISPKAFAETVLGDRHLFMSGDRALLATQSEKLNTDELKSILETIEKSRAADVNRYSGNAVTCLSKRLASGQIRSIQDAEDWNRAFHQAEDKQCIKLMVNTLPNDFGRYLDDSSIDCIRAAIEPDKNAQPWKLFNWGFYLHTKLARYNDAEIAYREAIARDPKLALPWNNLGNLMQYHLNRHGEAEALYREAIARNPKSALPWNNLGNLLQYKLNKYAEAEKAYREAIAIDPNYAPAWINLGDLLANKLQRFDEAETAYREASARDPKINAPWSSLGDLLRDHLHRYSEAEATYKKALDLNPHDAISWNGLGNLYCDFLNRPSDADAAYEAALRTDMAKEISLQNRIFLHRDFMGEGSATHVMMNELEALSKPNLPDTTALQKALFAAYDSNWGLAQNALSKAIAIREDGFVASNTDDWLRCSAVLLHLNYGTELLEFLDERGDTARLRPWVEALRAVQIGNKKALQNVAPEIRVTAEQLYDGIERRLNQLPESTNRRPKKKKTQSRKR